MFHLVPTNNRHIPQSADRGTPSSPEVTDCPCFSWSGLAVPSRPVLSHYLNYEAAKGPASLTRRLIRIFESHLSCVWINQATPVDV